MTKTYSFTNIFGPQMTQSEIFNSTVKAKMLGLLNGRNFTLLAYGASGSGNTRIILIALWYIFYLTTILI